MSTFGECFLIADLAAKRSRGNGSKDKYPAYNSGVMLARPIAMHPAPWFSLVKHLFTVTSFALTRATGVHSSLITAFRYFASPTFSYRRLLRRDYSVTLSYFVCFFFFLIPECYVNFTLFWNGVFQTFKNTLSLFRSSACQLLFTEVRIQL